MKQAIKYPITMSSNTYTIVFLLVASILAIPSIASDNFGLGEELHKRKPSHPPTHAPAPSPKHKQKPSHPPRHEPAPAPKHKWWPHPPLSQESINKESTLEMEFSDKHKPFYLPKHAPAPSPKHAPAPSPKHKYWRPHSPSSPKHAPAPSPKHKWRPHPPLSQESMDQENALETEFSDKHKLFHPPKHAPSPSPKHAPAPSPKHKWRPHLPSSPKHAPAPSPKHKRRPHPPLSQESIDKETALETEFSDKHKPFHPPRHAPAPSPKHSHSSRKHPHPPAKAPKLQPTPSE